MTLENAIRLLAGSLVLIGLTLGLLVNPWFFVIVGFVGLNLTQSSLTGLCPAETVLRKMSGRADFAVAKSPISPITSRMRWRTHHDSSFSATNSAGMEASFHGRRRFPAWANQFAARSR